MRVRLTLVSAVVVTACAVSAQQGWRDPAPHKVRFVTVGSSVKLEVLDFGGHGVPLVLLGCYLTGHVYDDFAPKLTDEFQVYAFTRRGIGASDRPPVGYDLQRSADDLRQVLDALNLRKPVLVANSCGGATQTLMAAQHPHRLGGLVYLEAAEDPTLMEADYHLPPVDMANQPKRAERPALDTSSIEAYRRTQKVRSGVAFPEAELRHDLEIKPDGSLGRFLLPTVIRQAITVDARRKPDYSRIRVPVLALFRTPPSLEEEAKGYVIQNERQRTALGQSLEAEKARTLKWEADLRAGVPGAKIVELPGASIYMFLSHEADVLREVRAFVRGLPKS